MNVKIAALIIGAIILVAGVLTKVYSQNFGSENIVKDLPSLSVALAIDEENKEVLLRIGSKHYIRQYYCHGMAYACGYIMYEIDNEAMETFIKDRNLLQGK